MEKDTNILLEELLRKEFDSYSLLDLVYLGKGKQLIKCARDLGLYKFAREMDEDMQSELLK